MNPRLFCRERTFHQALLLTYSFDPLFFEQVVLPDLWAGKTSDILIIGDSNQIRSSMQDAGGQIWHLGKKYLLSAAQNSGAFHPKVLLRFGATEGAVMIGSGNLTSCGWGGNRELGTAWLFGPNHEDKGVWLYSFLDQVISWCSGDLEKDAVRRMKDLPWLPTQSVALSQILPFLYSSRDRALGATLAQRWSGRRFSDVRVFTGSTDEGGAFLRWAHTTFGVQRAVIALTPALASFTLEKLAGLPLDLRLIPVPNRTPLHAKFYFFDGPDGPAAVMGSPNCSAAAWLLPPQQGGNVETAVIYDSPLAVDFESILELFQSPSMKPEEVLTGTKPKQGEVGRSNCHYDLVGLRWEASANRMNALINPELDPGTSLTLLFGARQYPMQATSGRPGNEWFCEVPEGIDFTSTAFASVRITRGGQDWITDSRWIDHLAELLHSSQAGRFLEPIKGLENRASSAEQRRILDDLQLVAQALFSDSATFKDTSFGIVQQIPEDSEAPAPPVDPAQLIRNLEDLRELSVVSVGATPGSLSLHGILRLLFETERAEVDGEVAADDEKLDEGQLLTPTSPEVSKRNNLPEEPEKQKSVEAKLESRLARQMGNFLDNLSKPEFAETCSATQLIQAVSFPLAVALRGRARGWVSTDSAERWGLRVVSLLFRGRTIVAPGLLRAVEKRYKEHGQENIFHEIVGDGTLWIVLIATLGNSRWQGKGTFLDKSLALREVFKAPELISSVQVSRLAGLLGQLRIDDASAYVSLVAPTVSELLDRIEEHLRPVWQRETRLQVERPITHWIGDLFWRANVGWAVCLAEARGRESVTVRRRGEEVKIGGGFYVNVSDLALRDHLLSELLEDLRIRAVSPVLSIELQA